uniref:Regucalcin n=1 Tax=Arion vulgaris TaxID=1028688 RepID=A0A0B7AKI1_9EUPU
MANQYQIDVVLENCFSSIGEGPHWESSSQRLVCIDIFSGGVLRVDTTTKEFSEIQLGESIGFVIPRSKGGYIVGLSNTVAKLDFESATVERLVEVEKGTQNRFNDGKCDSLGRLWSGTMAPITPGNPILALGNLYSLSTDHKLNSHLTEIGISNGLGWSKDNSVMYYIDSKTLRVDAFDFDLSNGTLSNQRTVATSDDESVLPDGMCVDDEGKLWVAFYRGSKVCRIDPETGKTIQTITFPVTNITSCCFGGKNLDELYVTSGRYGIPDLEIKEKQPLAGSLFRVTGLGVKGVNANNFEG